MKILKLSVTGLRALSQAEFVFQPGMNLLVGINGVGKTTVLDALRISLSKIIPELFGIKISKQFLEITDVRIGMQSAQVSCDFEYANSPINLVFTKKTEKTLIKDTSTNRDVFIEMPEIEQITPSTPRLLPNLKSKTARPLVVFFSTKRSILVNQKPTGSMIAGGLITAFSDSLKVRETNLRTIAEWYKVQEELGKDNPNGLKHVKVLKSAIELFMPGFKNLSISEIQDKPSLSIDKNGITLDLNQLSDGERGLLSIVLELAKRLSQANPVLENPLKEGSAIVLIDELDLHIHPKWQRTVVENLTRTFPNCQFIATTHSPQIISSVEPNRIQVIKDGLKTTPERSLGLDSNWILRFLMEADERSSGSHNAINEVEELINEAEFSKAQEAMSKFKMEGLDLPEWSEFEARIARLNILGEEK